MILLLCHAQFNNKYGNMFLPLKYSKIFVPFWKIYLSYIVGRVSYEIPLSYIGLNMYTMYVKSMHDRRAIGKWNPMGSILKYKTAKIIDTKKFSQTRKIEVESLVILIFPQILWTPFTWLTNRWSSIPVISLFIWAPLYTACIQWTGKNTN